MYAISLLNIFDHLGPYSQNKTGYTSTGEGVGPVQIDNVILDGFRKFIVFLIVGTIPITILLNNSPPLALWLIKFSSAKNVMSYISSNGSTRDITSRFDLGLDKAKVGAIPWYKVICENGFNFERTDPDLDPKGYNAIIPTNLSNLYPHDLSINQNILGNGGNHKQIFSKEILYIILEPGKVDAFFAYNHESISGGLSYIQLHLLINLETPTFSNFYKKAFYTIGKIGKHKCIEAIYFVLTILCSSKNIAVGFSFIICLISSNTGKTMLEHKGVELFKKPIVEDDFNRLPLHTMISSWSR